VQRGREGGREGEGDRGTDLEPPVLSLSAHRALKAGLSIVQELNKLGLRHCVGIASGNVRERGR